MAVSSVNFSMLYDFFAGLFQRKGMFGERSRLLFASISWLSGGFNLYRSLPLICLFCNFISSL